MMDGTEMLRLAYAFVVVSAPQVCVCVDGDASKRKDDLTRPPVLVLYHRYYVFTVFPGAPTSGRGPERQRRREFNVVGEACITGATGWGRRRFFVAAQW